MCALILRVLILLPSPYCSGTRRGTYAAPSGASRRRGPRSTTQGASGHSANSGDSLADEDEDA